MSLAHMQGISTLLQCDKIERLDKKLLFCSNTIVIQYCWYGEYEDKWCGGYSWFPFMWIAEQRMNTFTGVLYKMGKLRYINPKLQIYIQCKLFEINRWRLFEKCL